MKNNNFNKAIIGIFITTLLFISCKEVEKKSQDDYRGNVENANIVMLGNSITYSGNWSKVLQRNDVFNAGQPGWTTEQLSWIIKDFITPFKPKLCFFSGGTNDFTLGIPLERVYNNICMVMDSINNVGTIPIFQTPLYQRGAKERNLQYDKLNEMVKKFCQDRNYDFVDLRQYLCADGDIIKKYVLEDNTHLKPEAYPEWAKAIQPIINKHKL